MGGLYKGSMEGFHTLIGLIADNLGLKDPYPNLKIVEGALKPDWDSTRVPVWRDLRVEIGEPEDLFHSMEPAVDTVSLGWRKLAWMHDDDFIHLKLQIRLMVGYDPKEYTVYIMAESWYRWEEVLRFERTLEGYKKMLPNDRRLTETKPNG